MPRSLRLEFPGAYYHVMAREWGQSTRINIKEVICESVYSDPTNECNR